MPEFYCWACPVRKLNYCLVELTQALSEAVKARKTARNKLYA
jgi:hypothetical protein